MAVSLYWKSEWHSFSKEWENRNYAKSRVNLEVKRNKINVWKYIGGISSKFWGVKDLHGSYSLKETETIHIQVWIKEKYLLIIKEILYTCVLIIIKVIL